MAIRKVPLVTNQFYHILNRGIALQPVFRTKWDFKRAINLLIYYQNADPPLRYSQLMTLLKEQRDKILDSLKKEKNFAVEIIAYCLMPNHFHFLLKQAKTKGVSTFISKFTNSYTKYFNVKNKRNGPLFQGNFKAIRIETENQLLHLSRYIHLNPFSAHLVKDTSSLKEYPYSSLKEYLDKNAKEICHKQIILNYFKKPQAYQKFILNRADYQRRLEEIKHLALEK